MRRTHTRIQPKRMRAIGKRPSNLRPMAPAIMAPLLADDGCYETGDAVSGSRNVVMDFGAQTTDGASSDGWGADLFGIGLLPDSASSGATVENDYKDFVNGWRYCSTSVPGWVGLGTNDSAGPVGTTSGEVWGNLTTALRNVYDDNVDVRGGDDIETDYAAPGAAKDWIGGSATPAQRGSSGTAGFQASGNSYFDYGDAAGCQASGSCNNSWTDLEVYDKDYGYAGAVPMPESYTQGQASDWTSVDDNAGSPVYDSVMATSSYDTPQTGWQYLANATGQNAPSVTTIQSM